MLSGVSVFLATRLFVRDRLNYERAQVDQLGVWVTTELKGEEFEQFREVVDLSGGTLRTIVAQLHVRNASNLPMRVAKLAVELHTRWLVPDPTSVDPLTGKVIAHDIRRAAAPHRTFYGPFLVPPQATLNFSEHPFDVSSLAPEGATQLSVVQHSVALVTRILVTDNAGRRWEIRPTSGGLARRVGRKWRPADYQSLEW